MTFAVEQKGEPMSKDTIYRQAAIEALEAKKDKSAKGDMGCFYNTIIQNDIDALKGLPSAQPEQIARDIATIIENEKDMRVILKNTEPEQRWIPVTERLPDELAEVNVTWENTEPEPYYDFVKGHCFTGTAVYFCGRWYWYSAVCVDYLREYGFSPNDEMDDAIKVHAWMPLPEPYREEEQDG